MDLCEFKMPKGIVPKLLPSEECLNYTRFHEEWNFYFETLILISAERFKKTFSPRICDIITPLKSNKTQLRGLTTTNYRTVLDA